MDILNSYNQYQTNFGNQIRIDNINNYVVFDLETTGFSPTYDKIIEIGAVKVRNDEIIDEMSTFVKIETPLPELITNITGINDNDLSEGIDIEYASKKLETFMGDDYLIGHNVKFDINFVNSALGYNLENSYFDTMVLARRIYKSWPHHKLEDLKNNFKIQSSQSHRALSDVKVTFEAFKILKNKYLDMGLSSFEVPKRLNKKLIQESAIDFTKYVADETSFIYNKKIVFTGSLKNLKRSEALQICEVVGAIPQKSITRKTNILVVGDIDYKISIDGIQTTKIIKAYQLIENKHDLIIISETDFLNMINYQKRI
ncbi:exonuclease domain-containing protein [Lactococcus raffinolactis]|jgi:DNA polymerase III subunit epsilon|uniref:exonuclease domain-containing protein n=1 Tax=Pseudolactococcus raffinolactis TaxID=1366 RepID=UPI001436FE83|nr:exonuclease domain-containing protein [Lactococcus raffinolactis]QIW55954.1 hypothetical protein GU335_04720 [Lactococcus raffinolactis]